MFANLKIKTLVIGVLGLLIGLMLAIGVLGIVSADRSIALVGREDPLALGDDLGRGLVQLLVVHLVLRPFSSC